MAQPNIALALAASLECRGFEPDGGTFVSGSTSNDSSWWITDSGATCHMSPNRDWFSHISTEIVRLRVAHGVASSPDYVGTLKPNLFGARRALWHPDLKMSLFSVSQNAKNGGSYFHSEKVIELRSPAGLCHKVEMRDNLPCVKFKFGDEEEFAHTCVAC